MNLEENNVNENINLLLKKFKSIAEITESYGRYDIIVYNYDEIDQISKFIEEEMDIESWTVLKTKINPKSDTILY